MEVFGLSDVGCARSVNQDSFAAKMFGNNMALAVVCDGMGGAKSGEVASGIALDSFVLDLTKMLIEDKPLAGITDKIASAVVRAGKAVTKRSMTDPECEGMGTTLVGALVIGSDAYVANVGDSRAYHISDDSILRVTRDHSVVEDMVARGEITFDEARHHPNRNLITRVLGSSRDEEADVFPIYLRDGDQLILCSDGLSNLLMGDEILEIAQMGETVEDKCRALVDEAILRGAPDNVTVVIIKV